MALTDTAIRTCPSKGASLPAQRRPRVVRADPDEWRQTVAVPVSVAGSGADALDGDLSRHAAH